MIRDLTDPRVDALIQRHRTYWWNQEANPEKRPLYQVVRAYSMGDTPDPHELEPPPLLDQASFRAHIEAQYDQQANCPLAVVLFSAWSKIPKISVRSTSTTPPEEKEKPCDDSST